MSYRTKAIVALTTGTAILLSGCSSSQESSPNTASAISPIAISPIDEEKKWVNITGQGPECVIGMQHVLSGRTVERVLGPGNNDILCKQGDVVLPGELPDNYDKTLESKRHAWEGLLATVKTIVEKRDRPDAQIVIPNFRWVYEVGSKRGARGIDLTDGGGEGYNVREYGPQDCSIPGDVNPVTVKHLGTLTSGNRSYELGLTAYDTEGSGARCDPNKFVLIDAGEVSAV
jgi:hypothetical protein